MSRRLAIGIDPGQKTGIAVYDRAEKQLCHAETVGGAYAAIESVRKLAGINTSDIIVESTLKLPTFGEHDNDDAADRMARNVGMVQAQTKEIIEVLTRLGYNVKTVLPRRGKKITPELFEQVTGWEGRTSQHARDAAMLCWKSEWEIDHRIYSVAEMRVGKLPADFARSVDCQFDPAEHADRVLMEKIQAMLDVAAKRAKGRVPLAVIRLKDGDYLDGFAVRKLHPFDQCIWESITLEAMRSSEGGMLRIEIDVNRTELDAIERAAREVGGFVVKHEPMTPER